VSELQNVSALFELLECASPATRNAGNDPEAMGGPCATGGKEPIVRSQASIARSQWMSKILFFLQPCVLLFMAE